MEENYLNNNVEENNSIQNKDNNKIKELIFKYSSLVLLVVSFIYFTVYGFLENPFLPSGTASEIGLKYPLAFKFWGVTSGSALACNLCYMYLHNEFKNNKVKIIGYVCMALGVVCIMTCVHVPSTRVFGLQMIVHWGTALSFALFFAIALILFLVFPKEKNKKYFITTIVFGALLLCIVIALIIWGKNGFIESLPMWAAYVIIFLVNFTPLYKNK
ncbi:MAG: hypothetical protein IJD50_03275 [Clostridia bacterium]|nr:hypothetical protein [Clostridia bacterium]